MQFFHLNNLLFKIAGTYLLKALATILFANISKSYKILAIIMLDFDPQELKQTIGANLKKARITAGLSQAAVAEKLGITQASIALYESGKNSVPVEVIYWYALQFHIDLNELFGYTSFYTEEDAKQRLLLNLLYEDFENPNSALSKILHSKIEEALSNKTSKK